MYVPLFAFSLTLATTIAAPPTPTANGLQRPLARKSARPAQPAGPAQPAEPAAKRRQAAELFSLRARRRFAAYLRMRLLEMREEGLERAADAVERSTPVEELLAPRR